MADKAGLQAAVEAVGVGEPPTVAAHQLPLIASAAAEHDEALPSAAERRGPGRPPGARNRRTEEWVDYVLGQYRSPLVVLAEIYSRPIAQLVTEIGCTREDALKIQIQAARELAPYVHQKRPLAVNVNASGVIQLVLETPSSAPLRDGAGPEFDAKIIDHATLGQGEENQGLSAPVRSALDNPALDNPSQAIDASSVSSGRAADLGSAS